MDMGITKDGFNRMFMEWGNDISGISPRVKSNKKGNLLSKILSGGITFGRLKECLCDILKLKIVNIKLVLEDEAGNESEVEIHNKSVNYNKFN